MKYIMGEIYAYNSMLSLNTFYQLKFVTCHSRILLLFYCGFC